MNCRITINMDNAAFWEVTPGDEVGRILRKVASKIEGSNMENECIKLLDVNGNRVGYLETQ